MKYFDEKALENWNEDGIFSSREDMREKLELIENNPLPKRANFSATGFVKTADSVRQIKVSYSGVPVLDIVHGHEEDSEWLYPEISRTV